MERTTFSVLFYIRRARANRKGEAPVYLRLTVNGVRLEANLKKTILPAQWDTKKGKANEKFKYGKELNLYLDAVRLRLMKIQRDLEIEGKLITAQLLLDTYLGKNTPKSHTLLEVFQEHNEKQKQLCGRGVAPGTIERYETCMKHTVSFLQQKYGKDDIFLEEITPSFIEDYEFWFRTERQCAHNTTMRYLNNFKKIIRIALSKDWMKKDPFQNKKFYLEEVEKDFLEKHEIKVLLEKPFDIVRLEQIRDVFVFCCFTGLAFSDVKQLGPEHIVTDANGNKWIRKSRQKTKNMCNIPLLDIPQKLIYKYEKHPAVIKNRTLLPVPSNQKMNSYLKEIADICNIKKDLSTHSARHTFATYFLSQGVTVDTLAKMLGHSDTRITRIYAKVLDSQILEEMNKVGNFQYQTE